MNALLTRPATAALILVALLVPPASAQTAVIACAADLDRNGQVDVSDLLELLAQWGPCPRPGPCHADLTGSGSTDVSDLLVLLGAWGACQAEGGCVGYCGEASPDGWCDEDCVAFGDCVWNACAVCDLPDCELLPEDSCQYRCGAQAAGGCWCDDSCCAFDDCCADSATWCGHCSESDPSSCQGNCGHGGTAPSGCKCGPACSSGYPIDPDCCPDVCDACNYAHCNETCEGSCGGATPEGCWCDIGCSPFGDCCHDVCDHCEYSWCE